MIFFQYLYYRMYKAYKAKNDLPIMKTFMYVSWVRLCIGAVLFTYLRGLLLKFQTFKQIEINKSIAIGFIALILVSTYFLYGRNDFDFYENKFGQLDRLNKDVKIWMLIIFPILLFFGGLYLYVILFGGQVLGKSVKGLLNA